MNSAAVVAGDRVYVTEGEKAADAAQFIELTATTSPHGAKSTGKADWSSLAGKEVILLPDEDEAGRKYADEVARNLAELEPAPTVKLIELDNLPIAPGPYVARRIYRSDNTASGPYTLVAEINNVVTMYLDDGSAIGDLLRIPDSSGITPSAAPTPTPSVAGGRERARPAPARIRRSRFRRACARCPGWWRASTQARYI